MTRIKTLFVATTLLALLFAGPALGGTEGPPTDSQRIEDIQKQLNEIKRSIEDIKRAVQNLEALQAIKLLSDQVANLQKDVDALQKKDGKTRIALSPPSTPGTGRLELKNSYPQQVTIVVNSRAYRVAPGETRMTEPLPAGTVSFQVLEYHRTMQTRTLAANEVLQIHVHMPQ